MTVLIRRKLFQGTLPLKGFMTLALLRVAAMARLKIVARLVALAPILLLPIGLSVSSLVYCEANTPSSPNALTNAAGKPRWELGFGVGGQALPDYRGSNQTHIKALPLPLILYTGRYIKINRDGARGELFENSRIQFNLSADAALSGDGDDNTARAGMPELDSAFEAGPSLNIRLSGPSFNDGWALRFPARVVVTVGGEGVRQRGYVFNPRLVWRKPVIFGGWNLGVSLGALWGSDKYHSYYYAVAPEYATQARPVYEARAGYSGSYSKISLRRRWSSGWLLGVYLRYDNLSGATFEHSPLVRTEHYGAIGFGLGKTLWAL